MTMKKLVAPLALVLALVTLTGVACAQEEMMDASVDNSDARKAKILANLKDNFKQLAQMNATIGDIETTEFDGLQQGTLNVQGRSQVFLVSADDTKLWLVAGPAIDVSRSAEEIAAAQAKEAEERMAKLAGAAEGEPMRGTADAPVTIVEFSDFQCPYCSRGADTVEQILEKYGDDVQFVFKHFPLDRIHPWARPAAIAAECAANQDKDAFWTLHDAYFANQQQITADNVIDKSREFLADSGLDLDTWAACATDEEDDAHKAAADTVQAELELGQELGVSGTPGFFVNGQFLNGAQPITAFEPIIQEATGGSMEMEGEMEGEGE
jgi:protein-disulfide isomerase